MRWPGIGFTSASGSAYSTQNGDVLLGAASPGSSQVGGTVTYSANRISPSGLACAVGLVCAAGVPVCAATEPAPPIIPPQAIIAAAATLCHLFIALPPSRGPRGMRPVPIT